MSVASVLSTMSETFAAAFTPAWWWSVALVAVLVLRALFVVGRGPVGATWRGIFATLAGLLVVAQLVFDGADLRLLPLHVVAAVVVALVPWERAHPEAAPLRMGRARRRRGTPWPRALLLLAAVAAAVAYAVLS